MSAPARQPTLREVLRRTRPATKPAVQPPVAPPPLVVVRPVLAPHCALDSVLSYCPEGWHTLHSFAQQLGPVLAFP